MQKYCFVLKAYKLPYEEHAALRVLLIAEQVRH